MVLTEPGEQLLYAVGKGLGGKSGPAASMDMRAMLPRKIESVDAAIECQTAEGC